VTSGPNAVLHPWLKRELAAILDALPPPRPPADDRTVRVWDAATGQERNVFTGHNSYIRSLAFDPDGRTLATSSDDGTVRIWDMTGGRVRLTLNLPPVPFGWAHGASVAFSKNGRILAGVVQKGNPDHTSLPGEALFWEANTGKQIGAIPAAPKYFSFDQVAFLSDGQTAVLTTSQGIAIIEITTGREQAFFPRPEGYYFSSLAVSADGKLLASGKNRTSPAGKALPGTVIVWDMATKQQVADIPGHTSAINSLAFAPDSYTLASGSSDETVQLWDVRAGRELATRKAHAGRVHAVAFAPDGKTLASCGDDGAVRLWDVAKLLSPKPPK
jgi:WD40 repeat protein